VHGTIHRQMLLPILNLRFWNRIRHSCVSSPDKERNKTLGFNTNILYTQEADKPANPHQETAAAVFVGYTASGHPSLAPFPLLSLPTANNPPSRDILHYFCHYYTYFIFSRSAYMHPGLTSLSAATRLRFIHRAEFETFGCIPLIDGKAIYMYL
jgi:hypothetical protein